MFLSTFFASQTKHKSPMAHCPYKLLFENAEICPWGTYIDKLKFFSLLSERDSF